MREAEAQVGDRGCVPVLQLGSILSGVCLYNLDR